MYWSRQNKIIVEFVQFMLIYISALNGTRICTFPEILSCSATAMSEYYIICPWFYRYNYSIHLIPNAVCNCTPFPAMPLIKGPHKNISNCHSYEAQSDVFLSSTDKYTKVKPSSDNKEGALTIVNLVHFLHPKPSSHINTAIILDLLTMFITCWRRFYFKKGVFTVNIYRQILFD